MTQPQDSTSDHTAGGSTGMRRTLVASGVGTVIEWFDFFVFASLSTLVLGKLFFPATDPVAATLLGLSTFTVGYVARPIGGIIFGHLGDRLGRKRTLVWTLSIMGVATLLIAFLPTYATAGVISTVLLVLLRVAQGVALGGEYGGAAIIVAEHAHASRRRGLYGSILNACASVGFLLSSGLVALLLAVTSDAQFDSWAWRIPFVVSALLLGVGVYIRKRLAESPLFEATEQLKRRSRMPLVALFRLQPWNLVVAAIGILTTLVFYYLALVFIVPYGTQHVGVDGSFVVLSITIAQCVYIPATLLWGAVSDRIGRRRTITIGAAGCGVWTFAFFPLLNSGRPGLFVLALCVLLFFVGATWGPQGAFLPELFRTRVRYTGVSVGYQVSSTISAFTPLAGLALIDGFGSWIPVAAISSGICILTIVALHTVPETVRLPLQVTLDEPADTDQLQHADER